MKPSFALNLSHDGIGLLHRRAEGWESLGEVALDAPDFGERLSGLRRAARACAPEGVTTKLVIPASQILYTEIEAPGPRPAMRRKQIAAALEGMTPYAVEDLIFDWSGHGDVVQVAVVARETLAEAEAFAEDWGFCPVAFVAIPEPGSFGGEPWFGPASVAPAHLPEGARIERDQDPLHLPSVIAAPISGPIAEPPLPAAEPPALPPAVAEPAEPEAAPEPPAAEAGPGSDSAPDPAPEPTPEPATGAGAEPATASPAAQGQAPAVLEPEPAAATAAPEDIAAAAVPEGAPAVLEPEDILAAPEAEAAVTVAPAPAPAAELLFDPALPDDADFEASLQEALREAAPALPPEDAAAPAPQADTEAPQAEAEAPQADAAPEDAPAPPQEPNPQDEPAAPASPAPGAAPELAFSVALLPEALADTALPETAPAEIAPAEIAPTETAPAAPPGAGMAVVPGDPNLALLPDTLPIADLTLAAPAPGEAAPDDLAEALNQASAAGGDALPDPVAAAEDETAAPAFASRRAGLPGAIAADAAAPPAAPPAARKALGGAARLHPQPAPEGKSVVARSGTAGITAPGLALPETVAPPASAGEATARLRTETVARLRSETGARLRQAAAGTAVLRGKVGKALAKSIRPKVTIAPRPPADTLPETTASAALAAGKTVFGGRKAKAVGGKPKYMGLALTAGLVAFLAIVALWSSFITGSDSPAPQEQLAGQPTPAGPATETAAAPLSAMQETPAMSLAEAEARAQAEAEAAASGVALAPDAAAETAAETAPETTAAEAEAPPVQSAPAATASTEGAAETAPETAAEAPTATAAAPPEAPTDGTGTPVAETPVAEKPVAETPLATPSLDSTLSSAGASILPPLQTLPPLVLAAPETAAPPAPGAGLAALAPTPEGTAAPGGFTLFAGKPPRLPSPRPAAIGQAAAAQAERDSPFYNPALAGKRPKPRPAAIAAAAAAAASAPAAEAPPALPSGLPPGLSAPPPAAPADDGAALAPQDGLAQPAAQPAALATARPKPRPAAVAAAAQRAAEAEAAQAQAARDAFADASPNAVTVSRRPQPRPRNFKASVERALAAAIAEAPVTPTAAAAPQPAKPEKPARTAPSPAPEPTVMAAPKEELDEPEPTGAAPKVPTSASVAKQATQKNALAMDQINLIGLYGAPNNRRALVRMPNGRFVKVGLGDRLDGGKVTAIGDGQLSYQKGSRTLVLKLLKGG